jgi:hypothetical protein
VPMNWDMPILFGSLAAFVLSFIWSRATFVGPVLFAWAGAAAGGTFAFLRHFDRANDHVDIEQIVASAVFGAACGLVPGFAVRAAYLSGGNRRKVILEAFAAAAVSAGLGMIIGWIRNRFDDNPMPGLLRTAAILAAVGTALALVNWRLRSPRPDAKLAAADVTMDVKPRRRDDGR